MKILLVDDDVECLNSLYLALNTFGFNNILKTDNPFEALEFINEDMEISLVITDIRMPELDGIDILKHVKALNKDIGVIVISAYGDTSNLIQCINNRAYAFFNKPLKIHEVVKKIKEFKDELDKKKEDEREKIEYSISSEILFNEYNNLKEAYLELLEYLKKRKKREFKIELKNTVNMSRGNLNKF